MLDHRTNGAFHRIVRTIAQAGGATRVESDSLGSKEIPADAYWGINVSRALDNFAISGRPISIYPDLIFGYACVKQAAARANAEVGALDRGKADLIDRACEEIKDGRLHDQFVVDIMQGGAGTSTNMNVNEVIANRGLEIAGQPRGDYAHLDPNDHVNRGQSTNDTYPTALKIGLSLSIERLLAELGLLAQAFHDKGREFAGHPESRAHAAAGCRADDPRAGVRGLRGDAGRGPCELRGRHGAPVGDQPRRDGDRNGHRSRSRIRRSGARASRRNHRLRHRHCAEPGRGDDRRRRLHGAVGHAQALRDEALEDLQRSPAALLRPAGWSRRDQPPAAAGGIEHHAGQGQSGDSGGREQVAFAIAGDDVTLTMAAEAGQLQLNAFEPVMTHVLFEGLQWMTAAMTTLRVNCVAGITANRERLAAQTGSFVGVITALIPHIGYAAASKLAREALDTNANIADLVVSSGLMTREQVDELLTPERLTRH